MKASLKAFSICAGLIFVAATAAVAQDPLAAAPEMYKLLFENDRVRVMQVTFKPGEKIKAHSHPDHVVYALTAVKLRVWEQGKEKPAEVLGKVGDVFFLPAVTHWAENFGTTELSLLVTELKEPAPRAATPVK